MNKESLMEVKGPTTQPKLVSPRMTKLLKLSERVTKLNEGAKQERVAVRDPYGGYVMVVREIKA